MKTIACIGAVMAIVCTGCAKDPPQVVMVEPEQTRIEFPAECTASDSSWVKLPNKDVTQAEAARNYSQNKNQYRKLLSRRSVCRAAVNAYRKG